ncbi:MAG: recombination regulator RecX [Burkholderiales bacterium]
MKPRLSLKGRALQWLAQREHSRLELRRKLLRRLREDARRDDTGAQGLPADGHAEVESVLDWLQAHRYLSDERFVESRVHARASRFGNMRIHQELSQHGVELTPAITSELRDSEKARAREVQQRKFGSPPVTPADRARQARFLAGRGFSAEAVWQVLRGTADHDDD